MVSMLHAEPLFRNPDGISSREYNKNPPLFEFLSNLYGLQNPFNLNWAEETESSSLVSEISNTPILVTMMKDKACFLLNRYLNGRQLFFQGTGSSFL